MASLEPKTNQKPPAHSFYSVTYLFEYLLFICMATHGRVKPRGIVTENQTSNVHPTQLIVSHLFIYLFDYPFTQTRRYVFISYDSSARRQSPCA